MFAARRDLPRKIISDNAKTFKAATCISMATKTRIAVATIFFSSLYANLHAKLEENPWSRETDVDLECI